MTDKIVLTITCSRRVMDNEEDENSQIGNKSESAPVGGMDGAGFHEMKEPSASKASSSDENVMDDFQQFEDKKSLNWGNVLLWIAVVISIGGSVLFYLLNASSASALAAKQDDNNSQVSTLAGPNFKDVADNAANFKKAYDALNKASVSDTAMSKVLPKVYAEVNKNVVITSLSLDNSGKLGLSGTTDSYKSAALQYETLKGWQAGGKNVMTAVDLSSATGSQDAGGKFSVTFSISGQVDQSVDLNASSTEGGASVQ